MHERCNSIANALELRLSCTNPSKWPGCYGFILLWWSILFEVSGSPRLQHPFIICLLGGHFVWSMASLTCPSIHYEPEWGLNKMANMLQMTYWSLERNYFYFRFIKVCSWRLSWHWIIGSGNGVVLNRHQAFTSSNDKPVHWVYMLLSRSIKPKGGGHSASFLCSVILENFQQCQNTR